MIRSQGGGVSFRRLPRGEVKIAPDEAMVPTTPLLSTNSFLQEGKHENTTKEMNIAALSSSIGNMDEERTFRDPGRRN